MRWKHSRDINFEIEHHIKNGLTRKEAEFLVNDITPENQTGTEYGRALLRKSLKNDSTKFEIPNENNITVDDLFADIDPYYREKGTPAPEKKYIDAIKKQRMRNFTNEYSSTGNKISLLDKLKNDVQKKRMDDLYSKDKIDRNIDPNLDELSTKRVEKSRDLELKKINDFLNQPNTLNPFGNFIVNDSPVPPDSEITDPRSKLYDRGITAREYLQPHENINRWESYWRDIDPSKYDSFNKRPTWNEWSRVREPVEIGVPEVSVRQGLLDLLLLELGHKALRIESLGGGLDTVDYPELYKKNKLKELSNGK